MRASRGAVAGPLAWSRGRLDAPTRGDSGHLRRMTLSASLFVLHLPLSSFFPLVLLIPTQMVFWFAGSIAGLEVPREPAEWASFGRAGWGSYAAGAPDHRDGGEPATGERQQLERLYFARTATPLHGRGWPGARWQDWWSFGCWEGFQHRYGWGPGRCRRTRLLRDDGRTAACRLLAGRGPWPAAQPVLAQPVLRAPHARDQRELRATLRRPTARAGSSYWSSKASPRPGEPSSVRAAHGCS